MNPERRIELITQLANARADAIHHVNDFPDEGDIQHIVDKLVEIKLLQNALDTGEEVQVIRTHEMIVEVQEPQEFGHPLIRKVQ